MQQAGVSVAIAAEQICYLIAEPTAGLVHKQGFETDSNTSASWFAAGINAAKFGISIAAYNGVVSEIAILVNYGCFSAVNVIVLPFSLSVKLTFIDLPSEETLLSVPPIILPSLFVVSSIVFSSTSLSDTV